MLEGAKRDEGVDGGNAAEGAKGDDCGASRCCVFRCAGNEVSRGEPPGVLVLMRDALRGLLAGRIMALLGLCIVYPLGEVGGEVAMAGTEAIYKAAIELFRAKGRCVVAGAGPG